MSSDESDFLSLKLIRSFLQDGIYPDGISKNQKRSLRCKSVQFSIEDNGTLLYEQSRVVIETDSLKQEVMAEVHTGDSAGHCGINKTIQKVTVRYFWLTIREDVESFIGSCDRCQRVNPSLKSGAQQTLTPVAIQSGVFKQWGIDIVGPLTETSTGNKYILAATDYFSKWPEATALQTKDAKSVARFLFGLFCRYGAADIIISDQGREFVNTVNRQLLESFGVEHRITSPYHPQANGLQERINQTLSKSLQKTCQDDQCADWDQKLDGALFAARTTIQKATKHTPYFILFGREATLPVQLRLLPTSDVDEAEQSTIEVLTAHRKELFDVVSSNILAAQAKYKHDYDLKHNKKPNLEPGMEVLLANCRKSTRKANKFAAGPNFTGPYTIDSISKGGLCCLRRQDGSQLANSYNPCHLRPYKRPKTLLTSPKQEAVGLAIDLTKDPDTSPVDLSEIWLPDLNLGTGEKDSLLDLSGGRSSWLNDNLVDAASRLLREKYGDLIDGLHDTILNATGSYSYPVSDFVQIFHMNGNHWVTVSNIRAGSETSSIQVYDTLASSIMPNLTFVESLARYVFVTPSLTIQIMNIASQPNGCDCGLHAIASVVALCEGEDPLDMTYCSSRELRQHFFSCLENKQLNLFPGMRRSLPRNTILVQQTFKTVCYCRGVKEVDMVPRKKCFEWYHRSCINNYPDNDSQELWVCGTC